MTIDLIKEQVNLNELTASTSSVIMVDGDVIVPDVKPDIKEILVAEAVAKITKKELSKGKLSVSGEVLIKILYAPETDSETSAKIKNMSAKFEFRDSVDCPLADSFVSAQAVAEHIELSVINSRKINMKIAVAIKVSGYANKAFSLCTDIPENSGLEHRMKRLSLFNSVADTEKNLIIAEAIEVPPSKPEIDEILKMSIRAIKNDCKVMNNKVMIRGILNVSTLYSAMSDGYSLVNIEHEIPFTEILDIDGATEDCICNVSYDVKDVSFMAKADLNGEQRIVALEAETVACVGLSHMAEMSVLEDCYSPEASTRLTKETLRLNELINEGVSTLSLKEIMSVPEGMPPADAVYNIDIKPVITETDIVDSKLYIKGNAAVFLLYVSEGCETPLTALVNEYPFEQVISLENCKNEHLADAKVSVLSAGFTLTSQNEVEIRYSLEFYTRVLCPYDAEVVCGCDVAEDAEDEKIKQMPGLIIYFVQPGDTMWEIAKRYKTTFAKIISANKIDDANKIFAGQKLLIPRA
ncbi:MAG: DUF3794 domain-containing protein [Clostridia bacterium]|nr:DUF3794 domain-containing protein [Clostridia bacterium]